MKCRLTDYLTERSFAFKLTSPPPPQPPPQWQVFCSEKHRDKMDRAFVLVVQREAEDRNHCFLSPAVSFCDVTPCIAPHTVSSDVSRAQHYSVLMHMNIYNMKTLLSSWNKDFFYIFFFKMLTRIPTQVVVSWCLESSQPQRIIPGLKTKFNLSPSYPAYKSLNHNILSTLQNWS